MDVRGHDGRYKDWILEMTTHDEDKIIAQQARIEQLTNFIKYAQVSSGVCCCGDSMEGHPSPMTCGHSPVDMWDYYSGELLEAYPDDLSALRAHDAELIEKCAVTAWMHYADTCKSKGVNPHHFGEWIASDKIRKLAEAIEKSGV